jgi:hypothetical protein
MDSSHRRHPPPYLFFQSAVTDPRLIDTTLSSPPPSASSPPKSKKYHIQPYPPAQQDQQADLTPSTTTMQITVGTTPSTRTFTLPICHLNAHFGHIRNLCTSGENSPTPRLTLPTTTPATFQDYIDYTHSSIYSPQKRAPDYHPIHTHISAWILGDRLQDEGFKTAALRCLYDVVSAGASGGAGVTQSPVRPEDVVLVCKTTEEGSILRAMLFDAVASHWRQAEVLNIGYAMEIDTCYHIPSSSSCSVLAPTAWLTIYNTYADFHARLANR